MRDSIDAIIEEVVRLQRLDFRVDTAETIQELIREQDRLAAIEAMQTTN